MKLYILAVVGSVFFISSCATIVNDDFQKVYIVKAPKKSSLTTHTGEVFDLTKGMSQVKIRRSRSSVAVLFSCQGQADQVFLPTKPSLWLTIGNFFSWGGIGWFVDAISNKGYKYDKEVTFPSSLKRRCK